MGSIKVTYINVVETNRKVIEDIGHPADNPTFKPEYSLVDPPSLVNARNFRKFGIEGITSFEPIAWIDWEIKAELAVVEVVE